MQMDDYKDLKITVDKILNTNSVVRRKRRSEADKKLELFKQVINTLEEIQARSIISQYDLNIDLSNYDDKFLEVIDALLYTSYGKECYNLISFYLYERINPEDNTINPIIIEMTGEEVYLNNPYDLYNLMRRVNPKID
jgi:hypothetical protein